MITPMNQLKKISYIVVLFLIIFSNHARATTIVLDPGHGGADPGAIGVNGLQEKTVNMDVTLKLREELIKRGYTVSLTREVDHMMSLQERVDFKEAQGADLFVSIHANSYHNDTAQGSLVLYYDQRYPRANYPASAAMASLTATNRQFAQTVLNDLLKEAQTIDQGIVPSSVYVVRRGTMPSILVELAFLSNWEDATKLANEDEREKMAQGIANGIENFWPSGMFKDIAGHWATDAIKRLNKQGIIIGSNDSYLPDRPLTRAEFLTIMDRVFDFSVHNGESEEFEEDDVLIDDDFIEEDEALDEEDLDVDDQQLNSENERMERAKHSYSGNQVKMSSGSTYNAEHEVTSFSDLSQDHWAYAVLEKATEHGFIQGYPDGSLRPDEAISRAEVSVLFDRIWQEEVPIAGHPFDDVPDDQWFASSVNRLKSAALIQGVTTTSFAPYRSMTRAEIAMMIDRFI